VNEARPKEAAAKEAPASVLDAQARALLGLVSERREARMREIRLKRDAQVQEILRSARAEARESLHQAVARERARMAQGLRQAQARAELETRQRAQRETLTLLQYMWERIAMALEARWHIDEARSAWISAAVQEAGRLLGGRPWRIEPAADVKADEQQRAAAQARGGGASDVEWQLEPKCRAGLRVRTSGACLDATIEGLLADREEVEALFLSEYFALGGAVAQQASTAAPLPSSTAAHGSNP
jgi:vacuolar-type H+-ATPase subunit E/Vma4